MAILHIFRRCFALCSGGDRQGKAASKQPADSQANQSSAAGTSDTTAQRKEAGRCLAAKVTVNTHTHTRSNMHFCTCDELQICLIDL